MGHYDNRGKAEKYLRQLFVTNPDEAYDLSELRVLVRKHVTDKWGAGLQFGERAVSNLLRDIQLDGFITENNGHYSLRKRRSKA